MNRVACAWVHYVKNTDIQVEAFEFIANVYNI